MEVLQNSFILIMSTSRSITIMQFYVSLFTLSIMLNVEQRSGEYIFNVFHLTRLGIASNSTLQGQTMTYTTNLAVAECNKIISPIEFNCGQVTYMGQSNWKKSGKKI